MKFRNDSLDIDANDPFANDALERKPIVEFVEAVITKAEGPMVLALDSPWGTGKTTFVKMLSAQLERKRFHCIYFNAWSVDYATDPLAALVSKISLLDENQNTTLTSRVKKLKSIATLVGKRGVIAAVKATTLGGLDLDKEYEAVFAQGNGDIASDLFDRVTKEGELLAKFKEELQAYVQDLQKENEPSNLIFFIDELDRCRPDFAIELLERIKHLFDVPNIIFVLSIDKTQLEISTAAIYGANFNSREYLRRFIDLEFQLPQVSDKPFVKHLLSRFGLNEILSVRNNYFPSDESDFLDVFCLLAKTTSMSLRTQEQSIARLAIVLDQTSPDEYLYPILVATLIIVRAMNPQLYSELKSGSASSEELMSWIFNSGDSAALKESQEAIAINAYVNAADTNINRKKIRIKQLEAIEGQTEFGEEEDSYSIKVLNFTRHLEKVRSNRVPKIHRLMEKIDLTENFR